MSEGVDECTALLGWCQAVRQDNTRCVHGVRVRMAWLRCASACVQCGAPKLADAIPSSSLPLLPASLSPATPLLELCRYAQALIDREVAVLELAEEVGWRLHKFELFLGCSAWVVLPGLCCLEHCVSECRMRHRPACLAARRWICASCSKCVLNPASGL